MSHPISDTLEQMPEYTTAQIAGRRVHRESVTSLTWRIDGREGSLTLERTVRALSRYAGPKRRVLRVDGGVAHLACQHSRHYHGRAPYPKLMTCSQCADEERERDKYTYAFPAKKAVT